jgi:hypothetical protein
MFEAILDRRQPEGGTLPGPSEGDGLIGGQLSIDPREKAYPTQ